MANNKDNDGLNLHIMSGSFEGSEENAKQVKELQQIIRDMSSDKLHDQTGRDDITMQDYDNLDASILGHWLSVILISGRKLKIAFKVHYNTVNGTNILCTKSKRKREDITKEMIFDRLKEFCNLSGGAIKECLGEENSKTGLSLPLVTRGFDEVLFVDRAKFVGKQKIRDIWTVSTEVFEIICSSEIQVLDWSCLNDVKKIVRSADEEGEIEFL